jgi:MtN3 and saliva related transmembrane protein
MTTETTQLLGAAATLYGLGGALSVLLQARRMLARGTSGDVSVRFFAVYVGGFAVWLLYGIGIGDAPVVVVHAVGLVCGAVTLAVALGLRGRGAEAATARPAGEGGAGARPGRRSGREPRHGARPAGVRVGSVGRTET